MSVHTENGKYRCKWREAGRQRTKTFSRKRDADLFDAKIRQAREQGELGLIAAGRETLAEYAEGTWAKAHAAHLAPATRAVYAVLYDVHIAPHLGEHRLRDLNPELVGRWQTDLLAAGVGPVSVRKSMTLLGGILQRACESRRITSNPARLVRKAPLPPRKEVRPLAPEHVERLRAVLRPRDAVLVAILAYAGLRPQEARGLRWGHVQNATLLVYAPKTRQRRTVRLLAPLRVDLHEWRMACGRPGDSEPVIPGAGGEWTADGYAQWRGRVWDPALGRAGLEPATPYALRHSFASLLLHEGRSVIYVARQLGHGAELTMRTYGHVIDELEDAPRLSAEDAIRKAREALTARDRGLLAV